MSCDEPTGIDGDDGVACKVCGGCGAFDTFNVMFLLAPAKEAVIVTDPVFTAAKLFVVHPVVSVNAKGRSCPELAGASEKFTCRLAICIGPELLTGHAVSFAVSPGESE